MAKKQEITVRIRGEEIRLRVPPSATDAQIKRAAMGEYMRRTQGPAQEQPQAPEDLEWSDVPLEAARNLPKSMMGVAQDMVYPITNFPEFADAMKNLGIGGLSKVESLFYEQNPQEKARREAHINAVGQYFADRYGSMEGFKKTVAEDPAAVVTDLGALFSGGGTIAARAPGIVGKAGRIASRLDPIAEAGNVAGKAVGAGGRFAGKRIAEGAGFFTGTGRDPMMMAYQAGVEGGPNAAQFRRHMRGAPVSELADIADEAALNVRRAGGDEYVLGTEALRQSKVPMDTRVIDDVLNNAAASLQFDPSGMRVAKKPAVLRKVKGIQAKWGAMKNKFAKANKPITAEALDAFKQQIGEIYEKIPFEQSNARRVIGTDIIGGIRQHIDNTVPNYADAMRAYGENKGWLKDLRRDMSIGGQAGSATRISKLLSSMRSNVNTNFDQRLKYVQDLAERGGRPDLPYAIAGQAVSETLPQGLVARGMGAFNLSSGGLLNPMTYLHSPRLVGEAMHAAGRVAGPTGRAAEAVGGLMPRRAPLAAYAAGEVAQAADPMLQPLQAPEPQVMPPMIQQAEAAGPAGYLPAPPAQTPGGPTRVTVTPDALTPEQQEMLRQWQLSQGR